VFGRVSPGQKVMIVNTLKEQGRQVAMLGDGINDVLPIKNAHLGIAMGAGSRASKTVAGLVLETNDFGLLPETLREGRTIVRNLRRVGKLILTKNVYTVLLIVGSLVLFGNFPIVPQQVTLLNTLTIGIPSLFLMLSKRGSQSASRPGFLREIGGFVLRTGVIIGLAGLVLRVLSAWVWHEDRQTQLTLLLSALFLLGLTTLLRVLTDSESAPRGGEWWLGLPAAAALPVFLTALYWPPAAAFFQLTPLNGSQWVHLLEVVLPAAALAWLTDPVTRLAGKGGEGGSFPPPR
jgi:cation-transporting ATPase E